jgi:choline kinase
LTHFFGVGYHHLSESIGLTSISSLSEVIEGSNTLITHAIPSSSMQVDVKVSGPPRFWGIVDGRRDMKEASMDDVIGKLRVMKAK